MLCNTCDVLNYKLKPNVTFICRYIYNSLLIDCQLIVFLLFNLTNYQDKIDKLYVINNVIILFLLIVK